MRITSLTFRKYFTMHPHRNVKIAKITENEICFDKYKICL